MGDGWSGVCCIAGLTPRCVYHSDQRQLLTVAHHQNRRPGPILEPTGPAAHNIPWLRLWRRGCACARNEVPALPCGRRTWVTVQVLTTYTSRGFLRRHQAIARPPGIAGPKASVSA